VYVEGTLYCSSWSKSHVLKVLMKYSWISLLKLGRDILPTPQRVGGQLCLLIGVRTLLLLRCSIRTLPCICLMIYLGLVHDKFCVVVYDSYRGYILKMQGQTSKMLLDWDWARLFNNQGQCLPICTTQGCPTTANFPSVSLLYLHVGQGCVDQECLLHTCFFILSFF
jgi:hypothetical protein